MMTRQESIDLLTSQVSLLIKMKITKWLTTKFFFLAWGPFGPLVSHYAGELAEFIAKDAEMRAFFLYTDLRVDVQGRAWLEAASDYQKAKDLGDAGEVETREKILKDTFAILVSFKS